MELGQIVYVRQVGNRCRGEDPLVSTKSARVTKIGNKYFYLEGYPRTKFSLEKMSDHSETGSGYNFVVYLDMQDLINELEYQKLEQEIRTFFSSYYRNLSLSLEKLRKIKEIIQND